MADSSASIQSLYSGKTKNSDDNIDGIPTSPLLDSTGYDTSNGKFRFSGTPSNSQLPRGQTASGLGNHPSELGHNELNYANGAQNPIADTNALTPLQGKWLAGHLDENASCASSFGEHHVGTRSDSEANLSDSEFSQSDAPSRPLSRTSSASGFSTTATKDGIEGRRPMRLLPRPQFGKNNGDRLQLGNQITHSQAEKERSPINASFYSKTGSPSLDARGPTLGSGLKSDLDAVALPPISIDEKVELMSKNDIHSNR